MTEATHHFPLLGPMVQQGRQTCSQTVMTQTAGMREPRGVARPSLGGQGGLPGGRGYQSLDQRSEEEFAVGSEGNGCSQACARDRVYKGLGVYETTPCRFSGSPRA